MQEHSPSKADASHARLAKLCAAPPILHVVAAAALALSPVSPVEATVLRTDAGASATTDVVSTTADVDVWLRLDNDANQTVEIKILPRGVIRSAGKRCLKAEACELHLLLHNSGMQQSVLPIDQETTVKLEALGSQGLRIKGTLPELGRYVVNFRISEAGALTEKQIAIRRELASLSQDSIKLDAKMQVTSTLDRRVGEIGLKLLNSSQQTVSIGSLDLGLKGESVGGGEYSQVVDWPHRQTSCDGSNKAIDLEPGRIKTCSIALPRLEPGRYQLTAAANGPGLATTNAAGIIEVRDHWLYALLTLLAGGLLGAWAASWTRGGRDRVALAIEAQDNLEALLQLRGTMIDAGPGTNTIVQHWEDKLAKLLEKLRANAADALESPEVIAQIGQMLPRIAQFAVAERSAQPVMTTVQASYDAAKNSMTADPPDPADADTKLAALTTAVEAARQTLRQAGQATESQLFVFSWKSGLSARALRGLMRRYDRLILTISLAIALAIGLLTLWVPDATWGSFANYLAAFLTGLGLTIGGTLSLQQIAEKYPLPSVLR